MADFQRETAHRLFAQEFRDSRVQLEGVGEKDPNHVLTPLGAKVNRLHVVGVCTEVEPVGETGEVYRARISDPTGVFTVYAGNYQQEAAHVLSEMQPPAFVAVTGKARTYEPEPGSFFVSIRPEAITTVDEATRDQWILDTARRTRERMDAVQSASDDDAEGGIALAKQHYGLLDAGRYEETIRTALAGLLPGGEVQVHKIGGDDQDGGDQGFGGNDAPAWTPPTQATPATQEANAEEDAMDDTVFQLVQRLQGDSGAQWDAILAEAASANATPEDVEEALNRLMDKGLVYEPTLGVLKTT